MRWTIVSENHGNPCNRHDIIMTMIYKELNKEFDAVTNIYDRRVQIFKLEKINKEGKSLHLTGTSKKKKKKEFLLSEIFFISLSSLELKTKTISNTKVFICYCGRTCDCQINESNRSAGKLSTYLMAYKARFFTKNIF